MKNEPVSGGTLDGLDMGCLMQVPVPSHTANIVVSIGLFLTLFLGLSRWLASLAGHACG